MKATGKSCACYAGIENINMLLMLLAGLISFIEI
jgi:hypothetical protein